MDASFLRLIGDLKLKLRRSANDLLRWKLYNSSKWSAEALCGLCDEQEINNNHSKQEHVDESPLKNRHSFQKPNTENGTREQISANDGMSNAEYDLYLLASALFDCKEFDRCAYYLANCAHPGLLFLRLYSKLLSWDKKTQESVENIMTLESGLDEAGRYSNDNKTLQKLKKYGHHKGDETKKAQKCVDLGDGDPTSISILLKELNDFLGSGIQKTGLGMALLYYLRGVLYKHQGIPSSAITSFLTSITLYPFNWTCWTELLNCLTRPDESFLLLKLLNEKFVKENTDELFFDGDQVMLRFFKLAIFQEFSGNIDEFLEELDYLLMVFPNFAFLKTQHALINYHYMDYPNAEFIFDQVIKLDPYRLDDLDIYSNILYVTQKPSKLAYLAQFASGVDKFRAETCCIIANYYSAKQEHEKSIMYFRRALSLNKSCTSAWTLMGHEFVELKNSHAAIECYRRAVDINARDFKAWYGLGQAYEVLDMHLYSLYYFQKSCALKPLDKRMWQALASCYDKVGNSREAIKCFKRALQLSVNPEQDTALLYCLAVLHERLDDLKTCKGYMEKCVAVETNFDGMVNDETAKARLWLARYEFKVKNFATSYNLALGVTHGTSQEIEEARTIARECRRRMD
ncbi:LAMI_0E00540g1_1 [Lachancea mirantina]|uniref:LAMI_0E00540g1_1 n=1 Tax=Lachancea mirantina TaxID=1230905 RepID=A0A1G4JI41_9SACH|nr:LAMI_0E00540g1_1 [Lachancea mirantina]